MRLPVHYLRTAKWKWQGKWKAAQLSPQVLQNARGKIVLGYHGVDMVNDTSVNTKFSGIQNFEEEIRLLKKHTHVISLKDYVEDNLNPEKLNVAITFDDGFQNNFFLAKPVLEKHNTPATFFVTPISHQGRNILWPDLVDHATPFAPQVMRIGEERYTKNILGKYFHSSGTPIHYHLAQQNSTYINMVYDVFLPFAEFMKNERMDIYWKLMTDRMIKDISENKLFMIGSHGFTHTNLCSLEDKEVMFELETSKNILEQLVQQPVTFFASPFGAHDERTIFLTREAGYEYQVFATLNDLKWEKEKDIVPRFGTNPYLSPVNQLLFIANKKF